MFNQILIRLAGLRIVGKSPANVFLRFNRWLWNLLPCSFMRLGVIESYGNILLAMVRLQERKKQNYGTLFFRNRPQLELIRRLCDRKPKSSTLKITIFACSKGAEIYSILYKIRSSRPDLNVIAHAVDISKEVMEFAQKGVYSLEMPDLYVPLLNSLTSEEMQAMFNVEGDKAIIKSWIKEGVIWNVGDAADPEMIHALGLQDIVVGNNFLCHMDAEHAEACLVSISRAVKSGGYLVVSGIDLDVRTRVANRLGWKPIHELMEDVHDGDFYLRRDWPWKYWGLEPMNKGRYDWNVRYASVFELARQP
jgi:SAM-dependent methyltransferase